MTSPNAPGPDPEARVSPRRRVRWVLPGCFLVIVLAPFIVFKVVMASRTHYIGVTDPKTGIHLEYTISSRFTRTKDRNVSADMLESWDFDARPASPALAWFNQTVLRRAPTRVPAVPGLHPIAYGVLKAGEPQSFTMDAQGYPIVNVGEFGTVTSTSRIVVSGCPATYSTVDLGNTRATPIILNIVALHPAGSDAIYFFVGSPMGDFLESDVRRELALIRDSIKVARK